MFRICVIMYYVKVYKNIIKKKKKQNGFIIYSFYYCKEIVDLNIILFIMDCYLLPTIFKG